MLGLIEVHLYRPFSTKYFLKVLPKSVKKIAVLDRTKEPGSGGEPLYLDVVKTIKEADARVNVYGGRYGLSSKNTTPAMIKGVFDFLDTREVHSNFTVGINDDITNLSIKYNEDFKLPNHNVEFLIYGYGSDGMVSASKDIMKITGTYTNAFVQGYFQYDSKKSGGVTIANLRFGKKPITSTYYVEKASLVVCTKDSYLKRIKMLNKIADNGIFILNTNKNGGPIKIKNNNYINNLSKKPNTPDINHYNYNSNNYMDNNNQNQNPNRYINNPNLNNMNSKKDIKNDTMAQGWGFHMKNNNYNRKIGSNPVRPSTAPQKDKISYIHNSNNVNNTKINPSRSNQFANNNNINKNKIGRFNQRPSSAGGKSQNQGYGYVNNMNRSGNKFNKNIKMKKSNNISTGINKRLASPQMFNNANGIGFNGNNQNNLKNKFNPAKNRMPSPVVKSNIGKRPPLPNSGQRIHMNKSEKFS